MSSPQSRRPIIRRQGIPHIQPQHSAQYTNVPAPRQLRRSLPQYRPRVRPSRPTYDIDTVETPRRNYMPAPTKTNRESINRPDNDYVEDYGNYSDSPPGPPNPPSPPNLPRRRDSRSDDNNSSNDYQTEPRQNLPERRLNQSKHVDRINQNLMQILNRKKYPSTPKYPVNDLAQHHSRRAQHYYQNQNPRQSPHLRYLYTYPNPLSRDYTYQYQHQFHPNAFKTPYALPNQYDARPQRYYDVNAQFR